MENLANLELQESQVTMVIKETPVSPATPGKMVPADLVDSGEGVAHLDSLVTLGHVDLPESLVSPELKVPPELEVQLVPPAPQVQMEIPVPPEPMENQEMTDRMVLKDLTEFLELPGLRV